MKIKKIKLKELHCDAALIQVAGVALQLFTFVEKLSIERWLNFNPRTCLGI
ncbi:hypothetical protein [Pseudoalteromonas xiamenensis]